MTNEQKISDIQPVEMQNETGHFEISSPRVEPPQNVEDAITKAILDNPGMASGATASLSPFKYLADQVMEALPRAHPMDVYRRLFLRVHPSPHKQAIDEAFTMGLLVASAAARRTDGWTRVRDSDPAAMPMPDQSFDQVQKIQDEFKGGGVLGIKQWKPL